MVIEWDMGISYWSEWDMEISYWSKCGMGEFPIGQSGVLGAFLLVRVGYGVISYWSEWGMGGFPIGRAVT